MDSKASHSTAARKPRIVPQKLGDADPPGPRPPQILGTVAHHPHLLDPMLKFGLAIATGVLGRRESEILALRASWNCRSDFEWGQHVLYARDAGLSDEEIARVAKGAEAAGWSALDAALVRAADELHADQDIGEATWATLSAHFDTPQLVEIPFVVGQYTMLSMVAKATDVPVHPDLERLPSGE